MSPVKSRREQYSEATRAALLEAATRRFAEHGFAGTALEDVAADIQATRGTVYHHFPSKIALFQAVFEQLEDEMVGQVVEAIGAAPDPLAAQSAALEAFLDRCCDPVYSRIVWQEAPIGLGWRLWKECEERYAYGLIETQIRSLIDAGALPPLPVDPLVRVVFHVLGGAGLALAEADPADRSRLKDEFAEVILRMLNGMRA